MVKRNPHLEKLVGSYLFPQVRQRVEHYLKKNPGANLINLSVGDTTEPLCPTIVQGLESKVHALSTSSGYTGYGPEEGILALREKIAEAIYQKKFKAGEVFISDGANCDVARLQQLFGGSATIAVQDPSYPVYVEGSVIMGQTGPFDVSKRQYREISYLNCNPENDFFPDLKKSSKTDLIYFCSPNNPTGVPCSKTQLEELVHFAHQNQSIIIYDAAYASYIQDPCFPRSIYEVEGAEEVAIEVGSFSKMAGFTGVRLGWSIVPEKLHYEDGSSIKEDWLRLITTLFNGASNIAQAGGLAALSAKGLEEMRLQQLFYLENAALIKTSLERLGYSVYGGKHAPFLWVKCETGTSWTHFDEILDKFHIVSIPGSGFGPGGEGFLRFSAFGKRALIHQAVERLSHPSYSLLGSS